MSRQICVDASFVLKLVLDEAENDRVQELWWEWLAEDATIIAPQTDVIHVLPLRLNTIAWHH